MNRKISRYLNSEYRPIREVLLYKPGSEISGIEDVQSAFYDKPIDSNVMNEEFDSIISYYKNLNILVHLIDPGNIVDKGSKFLYNMMYARDLALITPSGAIISKMKHEVRRDEVIYAEKALIKAGVPVIHRITGGGTFEGADALWLNENFVLIGVGNRTNMMGFEQVRKKLQHINVECLPVPVPHGIQHLLGVVQFVDRDTVLVRIELVDATIIDILQKSNLKIIRVLETVEIMERQAMNIVTISPKRVIMPVNCPETKQLYEQNDIEVAMCLKISQLINGAGGLACATSVISRD